MLWLFLAALLIFVALVGLRFGYRTATLTETDMILAAAADYTARTGGAETDCLARPADTHWLTITCGSEIYHASRIGRLTRSVAP